MTNRAFLKNLNERPFNAIECGQKTIDIRANKNNSSENSINLINEGDIIIFKKIGSDDKIKCTVERKTLYKSIRELLKKEGTKHSLSSNHKNIKEKIKSVESIADYKEIIAKNGVFAIKLKEVQLI